MRKHNNHLVVSLSRRLYTVHVTVYCPLLKW